MKRRRREEAPPTKPRRPHSARRRRELKFIFGVVLAASASAARGAQIPFAAPQTVSSAVSDPRQILLADLDGDGDLDVVAASASSDDLAWFENTDGAGGFGAKRLISTEVDFPISVYTSDVDGDGDLDVLSASSSDNTLAWYPNADGVGGFGSQQVIATNGASFAQAADVDGDGDIDVVAASFLQPWISWYENLDGAGSFGTQQTISTTTHLGIALSVADVDSDGDLDVVSATTASILWHENTGSGAFAPEAVISTSVASAKMIEVADVDGDGALDVLSASYYDDKIAWYRNEDGAGTFGSQQIISAAADLARWVTVADVDLDGDLDVLSASVSNDTVAWYENDGSAAFTAWVISSTVSSAVSVEAGDVDGDGDLDVVSAAGGSPDALLWHENLTIHRSATFPEQLPIATGVLGASAVTTADIDGDGDLDVIATGYDDDTVSWYENAAGDGSSWSSQSISSGALLTGAAAVRTGDIDGDGDIDVATAAAGSGTIAWFENHSPGFTSATVSTSQGGAAALEIADVDRDGDLDIVAAAYGDDTVSWFENEAPGDGSSWAPHEISSAAGGPLGLTVADLDGDGDLDVATAAYDDDEVRWLENAAGDGSLWTPHFVALAPGAQSVRATDVDRDGRMDLVSANSQYFAVAWHRNEAGDGSSWSSHLETADVAAAVAADLDLDGDQDVAMASLATGDLGWFEQHSPGDGTSWLGRTINSSLGSASDIQLADLDGDGDPDVLATSALDDTVAWYPNRGGQFFLVTQDVAQKVLSEGEAQDLLKIVAYHRGRVGDSPIELTSIELRLTDGASTPLSESEALGLFQELRIYRDDDSYAFDIADTLVGTLSSFSAITSEGLVSIPLLDDDPNAQVAFGETGTFFVVAQLAANAASQTPSSFEVEHRTSASSTAEDAATDIELSLEPGSDLGTGLVDTELSTTSCVAPFDLQIENMTVDEPVVCEAGTNIESGDDVELVPGGSLTFRAGNSIQIDNGFGMATGTSFTMEIDSSLLSE
jgi:FG-GAP-like repeat